MTERPAQQSPDWDPTVADPLYHWDEEAGYAWPELEEPRRHTFLAMAFVAVLVVLAIVSAALFIAGLSR